MAGVRCKVCGGVEVEDACVGGIDGWISAFKKDNSCLRHQLDQVTKLVREALEYCKTCRGAEPSSCARCMSFRAWLDEQ
jgi:hypothetical protein